MIQLHLKQAQECSELLSLKFLSKDSLEIVLQFLLQATSSLPDGRHELCDGVFALVSTVDLAPLCPQALFESHRRYIDIQMVIKGHEAIGIRPLCHDPDSQGMTPGPYLEEKDIIFYQRSIESEIDFTVLSQTPQMLALFFPYDAHAPSLKFNDKNPQVKKIVIKVPYTK